MSAQTDLSPTVFNGRPASAVGFADGVLGAVKGALPAPWFWRLLAWQTQRVHPEFALLPHICDRRKASVDVGASLGHYTVHLLNHSLRCYAFEPSPYLVARLERRLMPRSHPRLRVEAVALSDRSGWERARPRRAESTHASRKHVANEHVSGMEISFVPTRRLDDSMEVMEPVGCIKVSANGGEEAVLRGAEKILVRDFPSLIIEVHESRWPGSLSAVRRYLDDFGYQGFYFERRCLRPIETFKVNRRRTIGAIAHRTTEVPDRPNTFLFFAGALLPEMRHLIEGHV